MDIGTFEHLVKGSSQLSEARIREIVIQQPISTWDPGDFWEWKQENSTLFGDFIVRAVRSLNGTENIELPEKLIGNLHITVPWYRENIAELCLLLLEEFVSKQMQRVSNVLESAWEAFSTHPDFSENGKTILEDFDKYRTSVSKLHFEF